MKHRLPSPRALAAVAVLTAWAGTLTWLAIRSAGKGEAATLANEASLRLSPTASWFAVYSGEEQVGSAGITLDTLSPGYRILETVTLDLPSTGANRRATRRTETRLGASLAVQDGRSHFASGPRQIEWTIHPVPDSVAIGYGAGPLRLGVTIAIPAPALTLDALPFRLALTGGLVKGRSRQVLLYGGWPPVVRSARAQVGRDSMVVFADSAEIDPATAELAVVHRDSIGAMEIRLDSPQGPYRVWVDRRGGVAGLEWPLGMHWVRSDFDMVVRDFRRRAPARKAAIDAALGVLSPLAAPGEAPDSSSGERRFRIERRDGRLVSGALMVHLTGGRQKMQSGVLRVFALPERALRTVAPDRSFDPLAQESAPAIRALATRILGGNTGAEALARLAKAIPGLAAVDTSATAAEDALGTLTAHRGRPDGLARLYVAIARAGGIEARYVVGVLPRGDRILTHAWAEVWDAEAHSWTAVDPVFGRAVAGAGLIRLGYAGSSYPDDLRPILSQARFTSLDATEAP